MPAVLTIDQRLSRGGELLTPEWVGRLNATYEDSLERIFSVTAGDEIQALATDASVVIDLIVEGVRERRWWVGVGLGPVRRPLGETASMSHGEAFVLARKAVVSAKRSPYGFAIRGVDVEAAEAVETVMKLVGYVLRKRGSPARSKRWQAIALAEEGLAVEQIAERLGVTHQAISGRLKAAGHEEERQGRALATLLLGKAMEEQAHGV